MTTWTPVPATTRYNRVHEFTRDDIRPTTETLDDIIGLDGGPVQVHADGTLTSRPDVYAPEVYAETTGDGSSYLPGAERGAADQLTADGWEPLRGHTGQHGAGADAWFMHASEFVGGGLADRILSEPGIYAAVVVYPLAAEGVEVEATEWAIVRRDA